MIEIKTFKNLLTITSATVMGSFFAFPSLALENGENANVPQTSSAQSESDADSQQLTIDDIAGTYEVTPRGGDEPDFFVTISENNSFSLTIDPRIAPCQGEVTIKNRILTAVCYNNQSPVYEYEVNLTGVTEFDHFQAHVSIIGYAEDGSVEYQSGDVLDFKRQAPPLTLAD